MSQPPEHPANQTSSPSTPSTPLTPAADRSAQHPGLYTSRPTLDVPAGPDDARPAAVKYMCAARTLLRQCCPAEVLTDWPGQRPHTRARSDTTAELPQVRDE